MFGLDIGLPLEPLRPTVERQLGNPDSAPEMVNISGIDRRGRRVDVRVTTTRLAEQGTHQGLLLVMEAVATDTEL